jgi:hypothetical protein
MSQEDSEIKWKKRMNTKSQSDTQGGNEPFDMEGQEQTEVSRRVNDKSIEPDEPDEQVDEKID